MRSSKPRKMRPLFLVLCEGETEEAYVNFLKQRYRLPIKIVPKVVGGKITQKLIDRHKEELSGEPSEIRTFLMYDGDVSEVMERLRKCDGILLISRPCTEIWFYSHFRKAPETELTSEECIKLLSSIPEWARYKKGVLTIRQQDSLWDNRLIAVSSMKDKSETSKTYSTIYKFINVLEEEKGHS